MSREERPALEAVEPHHAIGDGTGGEPDVDVIADVDSDVLGESGRNHHIVTVVQPGAGVDLTVDHRRVGFEADDVDLPTVVLTDRLDRRLGRRIGSHDRGDRVIADVEAVAGHGRA